MDNSLFKKFLSSARKNERVCYDPDFYIPYKEVLNQIYNDVSNLKYYTFDGRFDDILIKLTKNDKYKREGYPAFLTDIENEMKRFVVTNLIMLPINFLDSKIIKNDQELCYNINIFLPTKNDVINYDRFELLRIQEIHRKDKKHKKCSNLCRYFEKILNCRLDKEHIRLTKDYNFFNYPIMTIEIENIDSRVEEESGKIIEAIYCFIRILDFLTDKQIHTWGYIFHPERNPAHTYVVYYNDYSLREKDSYYGYSFRFNCSSILDIDSKVFLSNKTRLSSLIELYLKASFSDLRSLKKEDINYINRWKNSIKLFNTAFEFASTEKYDACVLILCSLLESLFLKNEGRNKKERLIEKVKKIKNEIFSTENIEEAVESLYDYRNKIIHEGTGYENKFQNSKRLNDYQGMYVGMKPFECFGAIMPNEDVYKIKIVMIFIAKLIVGDETTKRIKQIIGD